MSFAWPRFLTAHRVRFVTSGPNTARHHISVKCPWCGESDPSEHLGISLRGEGWGCLRNARHRGRSRSKLIQALLRCSPDEAKRFAGDERPTTPAEEDFSGQMASLMGVEKPTTAETSKVEFPSEFRLLRPGRPARPFLSYMLSRGYSTSDIVWLTETYNLHYALRGDFRYRLIVPVYGGDGALVSWTGRSIVDDPRRYKALYGHAPSQSLVGLPALRKARHKKVLVVCEGPFDAFRISCFGHSRGVWGTCLFGLNITEKQVCLLDTLMQSFDLLVTLLDPDAALLSLRLQDQLSALPMMSGRVPTGFDDPGELSNSAANDLFDGWLKAAGSVASFRGEVRAWNG